MYREVRMMYREEEIKLGKEKYKFRYIFSSPTLVHILYMV